MNVIVQYNAGNIQSVHYALARIGAEATVTDDPAVIRAADKVIFPGVGEASTAMAYLRAHGLDGVLKGLTQPVLGICLGMQLMCLHSEENDTEGLGIFGTHVRRFRAGERKVPQIGWNKVGQTAGVLFNGAEPYCYFVHSYYAEICAETAAVTEYGLPFSSALQRANYYGVQFHPEKSAEAGEEILRNFLSL